MIPKEYSFRIKHGEVREYKSIVYYSSSDQLSVKWHSILDSTDVEKNFKIDKSTADSIFVLSNKSNRSLDILHDNGLPFLDGNILHISLSANNRSITIGYGSDLELEKNEDVKQIIKILDRITEK